VKEVRQKPKRTTAEKRSAPAGENYFRERAQRADLKNAKRILKRAGRGKPPVSGDELD
jgi:hypothetical protein